MIRLPSYDLPNESVLHTFVVIAFGKNHVSRRIRAKKCGGIRAARKCCPKQIRVKNWHSLLPLVWEEKIWGACWVDISQKAFFELDTGMHVLNLSLWWHHRHLCAVGMVLSFATVLKTNKNDKCACRIFAIHCYNSTSPGRVVST